MNVAFCIGNGVSRSKLNLDKLKDFGPTYGCNQLIETYSLDNTIVVDKHMLIDLLSKGFNKKTNLYTRKRYKNIVSSDNLFYLDDPIADPRNKWDNEIHWGSGTHALNLAAKNHAQIVVMLGYDLYDVNLYSNAAIDPACWIYQIQKCFELYPHVQFVQIQSQEWQCPIEWTNSNFTIDNYDNLISTLKDIA